MAESIYDIEKERDDVAYENTFDDITTEEAVDGTEDDPKQGAGSAQLQPYFSDLAVKLKQEFQQAETDKVFSEQRFLKNLRQYRGQYDPSILSKIHPSRSKAFIRLTRTKVKTFDARLMDIQFPANDDKNWGIHPTPVPEMSPEVVKQLALQIFQESNREPTAEEIMDVVFKAADKAAAKMSDEINDQLSEFDYRSVIRNVVHSGHLYGTGILKGPMVKEVTSKRWFQGADGTWKQLTMKRMVPIAQFVPIWDIYPDMSATELKDCRFIWQLHTMSKNNLLKLANRSDFNGAAIRAFIDAYPDGNAQYRSYEDSLREMSSNSRVDGDTNLPKREKYELMERNGFISVEDAQQLLPMVSVEDWQRLGPEVACNVWLLDNIVIKAVLAPLETAAIPYYFYYFDKDETSIFGDGVPDIMRDPQMLYNASVRAMLDNAAISAGPLIEVNIELLADGEDPLSLYPFRTFQRIGTGMEANQQAVRVTKLPSYTKEFLGLVGFFQQTADESTTIPRALHGVTDVQGAGRTATGLSMLLGASNITLKDQVQFFDDGITRPFIKAMYFWNMEFNDRPGIKGDFNIVARGSKSLIAKEVKMEQINQFLMLTNNEVDMQYIKRDVLLRELAEIFDLDQLGFIRSEAEVQEMQKQNAVAQKKQQDQELLMEAMKAESSGHVPNAVQKTAQLFNIQVPGLQQVQQQVTPGAEPIDPNTIQRGGLPG